MRKMIVVQRAKFSRQGMRRVCVLVENSRLPGTRLQLSCLSPSIGPTIYTGIWTPSCACMAPSREIGKIKLLELSSCEALPLHIRYSLVAILLSSYCLCFLG